MLGAGALGRHAAARTNLRGARRTRLARLDRRAASAAALRRGRLAKNEDSAQPDDEESATHQSSRRS